jgi:PRC-barrel domain
MPDPVSWFLIETGWKVVDSTGAEVGSVAEVVGDSNDDIFNGLAVSTSLLGKPRYVPAERVGTITEGHVQLDMSKAELEGLAEFREPPTTAQILPDSASRVERIEQSVEAPIHDRPFRVNVLRMLWLRFRRRP